MNKTNEFLTTAPFDIYGLHLFQLVADTGNFTKAGQRAGLTQSAMTRQIRGIEERLGVALFERTTRKVALTPAGESLLNRARDIINTTNETLQHLQQEYKLAPRILKIGVARSIGLAYLPGFFFAFQRKFPDVQIQVTQKTSQEILEAVAAREMDAGLLCPPPRIGNELQITHRFKDEFTFIIPPHLQLSHDATANLNQLKRALKNERWLLLDQHGHTGRQLHLWLRQNQWPVNMAMELDSFDMIVNLVSLGLGVSLVPHRVLPIYEQRRAVKRIPVKNKFSRELAVVIRKNRQPPSQLAGFIENVLF